MFGGRGVVVDVFDKENTTPIGRWIWDSYSPASCFPGRMAPLAGPADARKYPRVVTAHPLLVLVAWSGMK